MIQSSIRSKIIVAAGAAILALALLVPLASAATPKPGYTQFAGCPSPGENPNSGFCINSTITGGSFKMGNKTVPIENSLSLKGGIDIATGEFIYNSKGGLTPAKQKVPGGVIGLTGLTWLLEFFGSDALTLYATTELAGTPSNPLEEPFKLPIKVHLETPSGVLGNSCYVGSNSNPITLNLTTKTTSPPLPNKPITGKEPTQHQNELGIIELSNGEFVDNSFAAPGASGCVLRLFGFIPVSLNSIVNLQSGLPSPAGTNETRQQFKGEGTFAFLVY